MSTGTEYYGIDYYYGPTALPLIEMTDANGAVTVDNKALNPDGSLASETISVTSANGLSRTLSQDADGDGVIDLIQTETTVVNGDGSKVTTLTDKTGGGVNLDNSAIRVKKSRYTFSKAFDDVSGADKVNNCCLL
jgi:hypothetical protein